MTTALTLYREQGENPQHDMYRWTAENLAPRVRTGVNYALVSYSDNDLSVNWQSNFSRLALMYPNAKVGFGEMGGDDTHSDRAFSIEHDYGKVVSGVPPYIGGYFYWYYCEDMVPYQSSDLWALLDLKIAQSPVPQ